MEAKSPLFKATPYPPITEVYQRPTELDHVYYTVHDLLEVPLLPMPWQVAAPLYSVMVKSKDLGNAGIAAMFQFFHEKGAKYIELAHIK